MSLFLVLPKIRGTIRKASPPRANTAPRTTTSIDDLAQSSTESFPYVTTQAKNNGVAGFYGTFTEEGNVLTIDSAVLGYCSYQQENFSASDHVEKLIPKFVMTPYIALFFVTIINMENFRYCYGKKFNQQKIKETSICLPVDN